MLTLVRRINLKLRWRYSTPGTLVSHIYNDSWRDLHARRICFKRYGMYGGPSTGSPRAYLKMRARREMRSRRDLASSRALQGWL